MQQRLASYETFLSYWRKSIFNIYILYINTLADLFYYPIISTADDYVQYFIVHSLRGKKYAVSVFY